jgi:hypothetical protein
MVVLILGFKETLPSWLDSPCINNQTQYEILITDLEIVLELKA